VVLVRAGSARHREPLVLGGHERSVSACEDRRSQTIHRHDLGRQSIIALGSNPPARFSIRRSRSRRRRARPASLRRSSSDRFNARRWASFVGPRRVKLWKTDKLDRPAGRARFARIQENQLAAAPPCATFHPEASSWSRRVLVGHDVQLKAFVAGPGRVGVLGHAAVHPLRVMPVPPCSA
jgi:hypothetical protein